MAYVEFCEMFSIGIPSIDSQHRRLIEIVNEFYAAVKAKKEKGLLFPILNSLIRYAEEHFRDEEKVMEQIGYPHEDITAHKGFHEQLIGEIFALNEELKGPREKPARDLEIFLNNWLIQHILLQDKKLTAYARNIK